MNDQDRKTEDIKAPCRMCSGMGWSFYENPCSECGGSGEVEVEIYTDCGCITYECDCEVSQAEVEATAA